MRGIIAIALGALALTGCTKKDPCCKFTVVPATAQSKAYADETQKRGFTKAEIHRCFGNGVLNVNNARIYIVEDTLKSAKGRYCHVGFSVPAPSNPSRFRMTPVSTDNYEYADCTLRALYCLRPEAAERHAKRFNLTIDKTPIQHARAPGQ